STTTTPTGTTIPTSTTTTSTSTTTAATTTTTPTTTTNASTSQPYWSSDFENGFTAAWNYEPSFSTSLYALVPGFSGRGAGLVTHLGGSDAGTNGAGVNTAIWKYPQDAHAGYGSSSPVLGQSTWYHARMNFPSGAYAPTTGQW